jgi:hypothetical protein
VVLRSVNFGGVYGVITTVTRKLSVSLLRFRAPFSKYVEESPNTNLKTSTKQN